MHVEQANGLTPGIYRLVWKRRYSNYGGHAGYSLAAVGKDRDGDAWFMPTDWQIGPSREWETVDTVERINLQEPRTQTTVVLGPARTATVDRPPARVESREERSLARQMAHAVLDDDWAAAGQCADLLSEAMKDGFVQLPPVQTLMLQGQDVRALLFGQEGEELVFNVAEVDRQFRRWLSGEIVALPLAGVRRVELFVLRR